MTELCSTPNSVLSLRVHTDPTAESWLPGASFLTPWGSGASGAHWLQLISGRLADLHAVVVEIAVIELASVVEFVVMEIAIYTDADAGACSISASAMVLADSCRLRLQYAAAGAASG